MNINWLVRLKNKNFWLALVPAVLLLIQVVAAVFGFELDLGDLGNRILDVVNALFAVLAILGIVTDPTTEGISDSRQALTYTEPKKGGQIMQEKDFRQLAIKAVVEYFNSQVDFTDKNGKITEDQVFVVWMTKVLQNNKALLSTTIPDGMYYEATWNGDKNEGYLDAYKKWKNLVFKEE